MGNILGITEAWAQEIHERSQGSSAKLKGVGSFLAQVVIPSYRRQICLDFALGDVTSLQATCELAGIEMPFDQFGIALSFAENTELPLFCANGVLASSLSTFPKIRPLATSLPSNCRRFPSPI